VVAEALECCCHPATREGDAGAYECGVNAHECIRWFTFFVGRWFLCFNDFICVCCNIAVVTHKISATPVESSGSSFSTSQSLWEKGFYLPMEEAGSIPTTVTVARNSLMKSNPVTQSSPRQRQAK
jgi:hypothetical protein